MSILRIDHDDNIRVRMNAVQSATNSALRVEVSTTSGSCPLVVAKLFAVKPVKNHHCLFC